jgi:competence protein ComEA
MYSAKKNLLEETEKFLSNYAYKIVYVPHEVIEDYNATYNVMCEDELITTNAAKELDIPLNEIWISEKWKPYAKYIIFHELREIFYRAKGFERDDTHEKAIENQLTLWRDDRLFLEMIREMEEMDRKTAEKKRKLKSLK